MKGNLVYTAAVCLFFSFALSCSTGKGSGYPADRHSDSSPVSVKRSAADKDHDEAVMISGIIDFTSGEYGYMWNTVPRDGVPVFFASTPRREFREEEREYCLFDAARQVSLYYAARVETKQAVKSNNMDLGYMESVKSGFDRDLALKIMPDLEIMEFFQDADGSYMLVKYPSLSVNINYVPQGAAGDGVPSWVTNVPVIDGMLVSVGVVQRSRFLTDSLKKADDQALANLSRQISINVKSKRTDIEAASGTAFEQTHYEVSSSVLKGFYVLERWRSRDGNTFYSLAVCKRGIKN